MVAKKKGTIRMWIVIILILGLAISPVIIAAALVLGVFKALYHTE